MNVRKPRLLIALLALAFSCACGLGDREPGADENLFLLYALDDVYARWPAGERADPGPVSDWLARTRRQIVQVRGAIRTHELDPDVGMLYDDCIGFLDAHDASLVNQGVTDTPARQRDVDELGWEILPGLGDARAAERKAVPFGESENEGLWTGLDPAIFIGAEDAPASNREGRPDGPQRLEDERLRLRARWVKVKAKAEAVARKLSEKYGWAPGEAGLDGFHGSLPHDYLQRRPRDPFVAVRFATRTPEADTPAGILDKARACVAAADLAPPGSMYDSFRERFLQEAANLAVRAAWVELQPFSYSLGPAGSAPEAVRLSELYLAANPDDPSRVGHVLLSYALAAAGRYHDAVRAANMARQQWSGDAAFAYHYAKLMSLTLSPDLAGDWLAQAYRGGFNDIEFVRHDADLANYSADRPEQFRRLTRVKWRFKIAWGGSLDDLVVANESPFELTDVHIDLYFRQGRRTWEPQIRRDSLKPGEVYQAKDAVSIPGNRYDMATGVLFCDQDP